LAILAIGGLLATGCGSSAKESSGPQVISAGQVDIQLPDGWKVSSDGKSAIRPGTDTPASPARPVRAVRAVRPVTRRATRSRSRRRTHHQVLHGHQHVSSRA
jgi:hypothetical protein